MGSPYVGEIRTFAGNFPPEGWMTCDGQLLAIADYDTLFNLIGTTYGGDGQTTFGLPNLSGRLPVHQGSNGVSTYELGQSGGVATVTLTSQQIPSHTHSLAASTSPGTLADPSGAAIGTSSSVALYNLNHPGQQLAPSALASSGGNQPHANLQPYQAVTYIISLFGIYPSPT